MTLLPNERRVDFVIASHVIEYVPEMVSWLQCIGEALRPGGVLNLAIPASIKIDKRLTEVVLCGAKNTTSVNPAGPSRKEEAVECLGSLSLLPGDINQACRDHDLKGCSSLCQFPPCNRESDGCRHRNDKEVKVRGRSAQHRWRQPP